MTFSTLLQRIPAKAWLIVALVVAGAVGLTVFAYQERRVGAINAELKQSQIEIKARDQAIKGLVFVIDSQHKALVIDDRAYQTALTGWNAFYDSVMAHGTPEQKTTVAKAEEPLKACNLVVRDCTAELAARAHLDSLRVEQDEEKDKEISVLKKRHDPFISVRPNVGTLLAVILGYLTGKL